MLNTDIKIGMKVKWTNFTGSERTGAVKDLGENPDGACAGQRIIITPDVESPGDRRDIKRFGGVMITAGLLEAVE